MATVSRRRIGRSALPKLTPMINITTAIVEPIITGYRPYMMT